MKYVKQDFIKLTISDYDKLLLSKTANWRITYARAIAAKSNECF